jgi:hypothetical protein
VVVQVQVQEMIPTAAEEVPAAGGLIAEAVVAAAVDAVAAADEEEDAGPVAVGSSTTIDRQIRTTITMTMAIRKKIPWRNSTTPTT